MFARHSSSLLAITLALVALSMVTIPRSHAGESVLGIASVEPTEVTATDCAALDLDSDGAVTLADLLRVVAGLGTPSSDVDLDGNGLVDLSDVLHLVAALGSPCASASTPPTDGDEPGTPETPAFNAGLAAQAALSAWLGVPVETVTIEGVDEVEWPDSCLGVAGDGDFCAQVITPGFDVTLLVDGTGPYHVHTNADATQLVWAPNAIALAALLEVIGDEVRVLLSPTLLEGTPEADLVSTLLLVPGTRLGVDPAELISGDTITVGLAPAPGGPTISQDITAVVVSLDRGEP